MTASQAFQAWILSNMAVKRSKHRNYNILSAFCLQARNIFQIFKVNINYGGNLCLKGYNVEFAVKIKMEFCALDKLISKVG